MARLAWRFIPLPIHVQERLARLELPAAARRVLDVLLIQTLACRAPDGSRVVSARVTNGELAAAANLSERSVQRALTALARRGVVQLEYDRTCRRIRLGPAVMSPAGDDRGEASAVSGQQAFAFALESPVVAAAVPMPARPVQGEARMVAVGGGAPIQLTQGGVTGLSGGGRQVCQGGVTELSPGQHPNLLYVKRPFAPTSRSKASEVRKQNRSLETFLPAAPRTADVRVPLDRRTERPTSRQTVGPLALPSLPPAVPIMRKCLDQLETFSVSFRARIAEWAAREAWPQQRCLAALEVCLLARQAAALAATDPRRVASPQSYAWSRLCRGSWGNGGAAYEDAKRLWRTALDGMSDTPPVADGGQREPIID